MGIFIKGKTREEQRNKSQIDIGKDKGRTEKHYPYSREELKNITHICIGKTREEQKKHYPYSHRKRQGKN